MTSERIVIHDPLSHPNGRSGGTHHDPKSASDVENMEETVEFRVMMAYATRRRRQLNKKDDSNAQTSPVAKGGEDDADGDVKTPSNTLIHDENKENRKKGVKKKKVLKHLSKIFSCTRSQTKDEEVEEQQQPKDPAGKVSDRCFQSTDEPEKKDEEEEKAEEVALKLTELADEIQLTPPEIEFDGEGDELEKIIGLLLRDTGDRWNEKVLKDANIKAELFWDYSFFRALINTFLTRVGLRTSNPNSPGPQASPKTQMAVMCEVTTRLSSVETLPANRLLNHGARYMQDYFSSWVQEQGGYEAAFEESEEVD